MIESLPNTTGAFPSPGRGEVAVRVVTAYASGCATVAVVLAIVLVRQVPITGQHARRRAAAWPTANQ
jgi:hypothetical protein